MRFIHICNILVLLLAFGWVKADSDEDFQKIIKTCEIEVPVVEEDLQAFMKSKMDPAKATPAIKCQGKCILEKQGYFVKGVFDDKAFLEKALNHPALKDRHAEVTKTVDMCKTKTGADDCETAFNIGMCLRENKDFVFGESS
ncbi:general odorant-binding protein 56h-like [Musca domestica]|uniref:General odorant-binding protein 56h-like n=1 Tax=Musca domestica TaxID=7370 RepID=A0A1I8NK62_MUSDO|nr:general odorant-binding protein 56h-like [Musca domestica]